MPTSKASLNSQSGIRLDKMNRITATGNLSLVFDNIIDGTGLTITAPTGSPFITVDSLAGGTANGRLTLLIRPAAASVSLL